jgi:hypothetical protein
MLLAGLLAAAIAIAPQPQAQGSTYRTLLLRAAPGRLLELIDLVKARSRVHEAAGEGKPLIMRHSQGDQWDLMILYPIGTMADEFSRERRDKLARAATAAGMPDSVFERRLRELVSWREEVFVDGPPVSTLEARRADAGFYHIEMFIAVAGKYDDLLRQRRMENDFLQRIGRKENLIFTRVAGASWDMFTVGFYRDLQHYAERNPMSDAEQDDAARKAGFESRAHIGPYLRTFVGSHHDTLATKVE